MKKVVASVGGAVILFLCLIVALNASYTVKRNEAALVMQMGKIASVEANPGLHFHIPFVEGVTKVYTGKVLYDIPVSDVITSDKKSMIADNYVIWTVTDPVKYYQTLGAIRGRAEERIEAAVYNATKNTISSMIQDDIIAARGDTLTNMITTEANSDIAQYGIAVDLSEIKELDLPDDNKAAVYERMISERNNIAASYEAQGLAEAQKIRNDTNRRVTILTAEAKRDAEKTIAEGEAEYMRILSEAYNDPDKADFYNFTRGLEALTAMAGDNKTIILDKDSEFAKLLYGN